MYSGIGRLVLAGILLTFQFSGMHALTIIPLVDFSPIKPDFGLFFWTVVVFLIFWLLVGKLAFRPIVRALKDRGVEIQAALDSAKLAREEMSKMKAENEKIIAEAREEKMKIIREAKDAANNIVAEAKEKAKEEAKRITVQAKLDIENAKKAALVDVKNQLGMLALEIAGKVIRKNLSDAEAQQEYVKRLLDEVNVH